MLKSILQEHIYTETHKLPIYWCFKEAMSAFVPSSISCSELTHKAGDLVLTVIFVAPNTAHQPHLSSHLTHFTPSAFLFISFHYFSRFCDYFCGTRRHFYSLLCEHIVLTSCYIPCLSNLPSYCIPFHV